MDKEYESRGLLRADSQDSEDREMVGPTRGKTLSHSKVTIFLCYLLSLSLATNLFQAVYNTTRVAQPRSHSKYANLQDDELLLQWYQQSPYTDENVTARDHEWDKINHDNGLVAVDKEWATSKGLALGSAWPWDTSKTIYFVNAYHNLHCLKLIYWAFMDYRNGEKSHMSQHHIVHCLDQLYADVRCNADDTLRVTAPNKYPTTAVGQVRSCRNWDALERWTQENTACFRYGNPETENKKPSQIPRMSFCPKNSPQLPIIREYFGKGEDWFPDDAPRFSWFDDDVTHES